jgi:acyl-CoA thioesterase FadM
VLNFDNEIVRNKPLVVLQNANQNEKLVATAKTVLIHFDFKLGAPAIKPDDIRVNLMAHVKQ